MFAIAPSDVWAVGDSGTILHYTGTWNAVPSGTGEYLLSVWASGPRDVYAVGFNGTVRHYDGTMCQRFAPRRSTSARSWD